MIKCREVEQNIRKDKKWSTSYLLIGTEKSFFYLSFRNFNQSIKYPRTESQSNFYDRNKLLNYNFALPFIFQRYNRISTSRT